MALAVTELSVASSLEYLGSVAKVEVPGSDGLVGQDSSVGRMVLDGEVAAQKEVSEANIRIRL